MECEHKDVMLGYCVACGKQMNGTTKQPTTIPEEKEGK